MPDKSLANLLHLSPRTISNYHEKHQSLAPVQSEHLLKLIALYDKGEEIFGNVGNWAVGRASNFEKSLSGRLRRIFYGPSGRLFLRYTVQSVLF